MPDMVGGNQYDNDRIDKEMMVRWAQASALMPLLQFSYGPWHFDEETVRLCREASELHVKFAPYIVRWRRRRHEDRRTHPAADLVQQPRRTQQALRSPTSSCSVTTCWSLR